MKSFRSLSNRSQFIFISLLTALMIIWLGAGVHFLLNQFHVSQTTLKVSTSPSPASGANSIPTAKATPPSQPWYPPAKLSSPAQQPFGTDDLFELSSPPEQTLPKPANYLGHLPYPENEMQRLVEVGTYYGRAEFLDREAAAAFHQMQAGAAKSGVSLTPMSGFRSISDQKDLFAKQIQRRGSEMAAAQMTAPPGYSEHHTGYAIDLGDGHHPDSDFKFEFENTDAYHWLANHAREYGFEISFPLKNIQGVNFEPWHWRYVGSARAAAIFARARRA